MLVLTIRSVCLNLQNGKDDGVSVGLIAAGTGNSSRVFVMNSRILCICVAVRIVIHFCVGTILKNCLVSKFRGE
jgi:hypothetical protein